MDDIMFYVPPRFMVLYVKNSKLYIQFNKVNICQACPLCQALSEEFKGEPSMAPEFKAPIIQKDKERHLGASLVVQWLRICLLMQGTRVRALVWEDPTCRGAAGPMSHNY